MAVLRRLAGGGGRSSGRGRRSLSRRERFAKAVGRIVKSALRDEDTYVFCGIAGVGLGVGWVFGAGYGVIVASAVVLGFGLWLGFWRLSARPGGEE